MLELGFDVAQREHFPSGVENVYRSYEQGISMDILEEVAAEVFAKRQRSMGFAPPPCGKQKKLNSL